MIVQCTTNNIWNFKCLLKSRCKYVEIIIDLAVAFSTKHHLLPYVNMRLYPVLGISFHPHYVMGACQEGHRLLVRLVFDQ